MKNDADTAVIDKQDHVKYLASLEAPELLRWAFEHHGDRVAIFTSFQDTGCVMIDMAYTAGVRLRVVTMDTLRLHPETYKLMDEIEERYGFTIERFEPDPADVKRMIAQHGEYLFFDSKAKQDYCCRIRKVEPNIRALQTVDTWITGLRQDHSESRRETKRVEYEDTVSGEKLKLSPLVNWSATRVREYIHERNVPYNKLYDQGYSSIGCIICSTPTLQHEDKRAGRWRWFNYLESDDKECGIHTGGSGI